MRYETEFKNKVYYFEIDRGVGQDGQPTIEFDANLKKAGKDSGAHNLFIDGAQVAFLAMYDKLGGLNQDTGNAIVSSIVANAVYLFPTLWGVEKN